MKVHEQCFQMAYHMDGGVSLEYVWWSVPVYLRNFYFDKLVDQRKRENSEAKKRQQSGGASVDRFSGEGVPEEFRQRAKAEGREGYRDEDRGSPSLHEIMENADPDIKRRVR